MRRYNPADPVADLIRRSKQKKARRAMRAASSKRSVASELDRKRVSRVLRQINPTEQGHANWASYNEGMSDAEMVKFESSGNPEDLLHAYKYAYGAQINYLDATMGEDAARMGARVMEIQDRLMNLMGYERAD